MNIQIFPVPDELMTRYYELANTTSIPNIARYAMQWEILATDAEAHNRPALAGMCRGRAEFYGKQAGGEYIRLINLPFSELIAQALTDGAAG